MTTHDLATEQKTPTPPSQKGQKYQPDVRISPTPGDGKNTPKIPEKIPPNAIFFFGRIRGVSEGVSEGVFRGISGGIFACRGLSYSVVVRWVVKGNSVQPHLHQPQQEPPNLKVTLTGSLSGWLRDAIWDKPSRPLCLGRDIAAIAEEGLELASKCCDPVCLVETPSKKKKEKI